ncbi:MAG: glutamate racemase [Oscillospiraceae bacterium]|jgi:glutamate racemase|nr:glutamate racemase [Oscillospiraceae bacterium]
MNLCPIGVFDSGLGGLTAVKRLIELLPNEDIVYLGDTGRVPYGSRSRETIIRYARQDAAFLISHGIKAMIVACNTVSSAALDLIAPGAGVPTFGVVEPPSERAAALTKNGRVGVIGTAATVRSGAYERAIARINPAIEVISAACPLFVPLAESGRTDAEDAAVIAIARDYLEPIIASGADTLILGCTHYPLLRDAISSVLGEGVALVDSGATTADYVAVRLREMGLLNGSDTPGERRYFVTDIIDGFETQASRFLEADVSGSVRQITLE